MAKLELENLTKRYPGVVSVDGINLSVEHGEFVCLLGPSGCGKTTTLRMIAGFLEPDSGEIRVSGKVVSSVRSVVPPERRNMSMIFQSYAVWPHMTVRQNVGYGLKMKSMPQPERQSRTDVLLAATKLSEQAERYPSELSGGQQQRVALARALATKPDILLLDEPLSNLDANLRGDMRFEIRRLHDEFHYTSVYVTHDQVEAMTMADRIVVMNTGRIEQIGTPEDVYERPNSEFVARFIGASNVIGVTHLSGNRVQVAGDTLDIGQGNFAGPGKPMSFCVKTHDVELLAGDGIDAENTLAGTVRGQAYLGSHRDYVVDVAGQHVLIAAPADLSVHDGSKVRVRFKAERCRGLAN
ncbi:MAG TPA: ABC transporter ATP-binding protein [Casimicrobiaceae bacterium]|jgi:iron(III) transport system ATP-binding protein|nr:ABC transporter ATP-binding protein [Casimicrobiaceae bacterium]